LAATERLKRSVTTRKGRGFGGEDDGEGSSRPTAGDDSMFETSASVEAGRAQKCTPPGLIVVSINWDWGWGLQPSRGGRCL